MLKVVVVGMKAVGALQGFFFPIGLKWSEALLAPGRLGRVLHPTIFTDKILAHILWMPKVSRGFLF
jgi:hypothetical protein